MLIYGIENAANNKWYIGQTINYKKRKREHLKDLRQNKHHNVHLQKAWNKYGKKYFKWYIIEKCGRRKNLNEAEKEWIEIFKSDVRDFGYNIDSCWCGKYDGCKWNYHISS